MRKVTLATVQALVYFYATNACGNDISQAFIEPPVVTIPSGKFKMGGSKESEQPKHDVSIPSFKMGKYEVTVKEFNLFAKATGLNANSSKCMRFNRLIDDNDPNIIKLESGAWNSPQYAPSEYHPALCVSADDAKAYVNWLANVTGKPYRLPTEAEWEYASRAGSNSQYFFGDDPEKLCQYGNVFDQRGRQLILDEFNQSGDFAHCDDQSSFTSVVGMYSPNKYGLHDTIGNVGEIVADCEHLNYQGAPTDGSAWTTECALFRGTSVMQIHRGGSYGLWSPPARVTSSYRGHIGLDLRSSLGAGFRIALDLTSKEQGVTSNNTQDFIQQLAHAQNDERIRRQNMTAFPAAPYDVVLHQGESEIKLTWQDKSHNENARYNVYKSESFKGKYKRVASHISRLNYIDNSSLSRKHSYVVTKTLDGNESLFTGAVATADVVKLIPGIIEAEDFNNMEGASVGNITENEDVKPGQNLTGRGGINTDSWTEYAIKVKESGHYQLAYRVASLEGSDGFELLVNNIKHANYNVPATGGWRKWKTVNENSIYLKAGQHKIRVRAIDNGWKLNWLSLKKS